MINDETKIEGMGSIPHARGIAFRVWAPEKKAISVWHRETAT